MNKIKLTWNEMNLSEKIALVLGLSGSVCVIVFRMLHTGVGENKPSYIAESLIVIIMFSQAVLQWRANKVIAIVSVLAAIFILALMVFSLII